LEFFHLSIKTRRGFSNIPIRETHNNTHVAEFNTITRNFSFGVDKAKLLSIAFLKIRLTVFNGMTTGLGNRNFEEIGTVYGWLCGKVKKKRKKRKEKK
jgi:hypothetical protein